MAAVESTVPAASTPATASPARPAVGGGWDGPSAEMRRFSAGMRAIVAMLCTLLLFTGAPAPGAAAAAVMLAYGLWAAWVLWSEANGRVPGHALLHYWGDVTWTAAMLLLTTASISDMFVLTLVQPVVLASIGYGVRHGVQLALLAALAVIADNYETVLQADPASTAGTGVITLPVLGVLALVPAAALLSRPMSLLRQRLALIEALGATLDPRRGLEAVVGQLIDRLRAGTGAQVVALVLPSAAGAPATLGSADDGSFRASADVHQRLEALLADTPDVALTHRRRRRWPLPGGTRLQGGGAAPAALRQRLDDLADLLGVPTLVVVPLTRYQHRHGHLLLGLADAGGGFQNVTALAHAAPELLRIVEQAALVDQVQEQSENHERARIGRDLHDSAIQPYLGLKFAVEGLALRIPRDNPARAEVEDLARMVNGEVAALRELISGLRSGASPGDNALVPAVRRQARRFAQLFGIAVEVNCPDTLATTRAVASALFHMVNEALNNIRKHSSASRIWITLSIESGVFRLVVRDDAGSRLGHAAAPFQPASLSERAAELGGRLHIAHPDGLNTELTILIPL